MLFQEFCVQPEVTILHLGGGLSSCRTPIPLCLFLEEEPGPCPMLHYSFLISPPLFLHSLTSLISNCLNLPFATQGRSRRLNETYFPQTRNGGHRNDLYLGGPQRALLGVSFVSLVAILLSVYWYLLWP